MSDTGTKKDPVNAFLDTHLHKTKILLQKVELLSKEYKEMIQQQKEIAKIDETFTS